MNNKINSSYKVIADHLRSTSFLIADGILPSNEGRGYVLRRIMRRAMLHSHKLNPKEAFIYKLVPNLIKEMGDSFPELKTAQSLIIDSLKNEEERFRKTLSRGIEILEEELAKNKNNKFSGKIAFKLYDTYGFPLDLTQNILKEKNIKVSLEEFDEEMDKQKKMAKESWSGSGEAQDDSLYFGLKEKYGETEFLGYETTKEEKAKIISLIENGQEVEKIDQNSQNAVMILDKTPFYATSGGQRGDEGLINNGKNSAKVRETKKVADSLYIHLVDVQRNSELKIGDEVDATVRNRDSKARNHSVTHLLHYVLKQRLGNQITQKGSNIETAYLTFDFNYNKQIEPTILQKIEDDVNELIFNNSEVKTETLPIKEAKEKGAMALFGEKYNDIVRVLTMGKDGVSVELCGGTHVKKTEDIGLFKITSEKSIAAGIRRITAQTNQKAMEFLQKQKQELSNNIQSLLETIKTKNAEIKDFTGKKEDESNLIFPEVSKLDFNNQNILEILNSWREKIKILQESQQNLQNELKQKNKKIEKLKKEKLASGATDFEQERIGEITLTHNFFEDLNAKDLREIITQVKSKKENQENTIILFFSSFEEKVAVALAVSPDLNNKFAAGKLIPQIVGEIGGKGGGGKPDLAFGGGNDKNGIQNAIQKLKENLK